jgi:hypothetical protein
MTNWDLFFPAGTRVLTLPDWQNPRLYLATRSPRQRWEESSFYPASRFRARLYRLALRIGATVGLGEVRQVRSMAWPVGEFAQDVLPQATSAVVLVGTPNQVQKITVQLRDENGVVLGYLKYAEKEAARKRLRQERQMLSAIPEGAGPELLKYGELGNGEALLTATLLGKSLSTTLPPAGGLTSFLMSLAVLPPVPIAVHPWVRRIRERSTPELDPWFEVLTGKDWPVTIQHGDFAPWNLLQKSDGTLGAIDWEYGKLEGFPYLDLAYYVLQISDLIYHRAPLRAAEYTANYLAQQSQRKLSSVEARALTSLAAYDTYLTYREDWHLPNTHRLQRWWRAIWESMARSDAGGAAKSSEFSAT